MYDVYSCVLYMIDIDILMLPDIRYDRFSYMEHSIFAAFF